ncbi:hypothetical protein [Nocardia sp. XZ_19_369]|uniref:hypothetical protein n=1 Tax=Nocardia sp. XZ_19_369 TaxID=2769487 RepID=UPI00188E603F|nr:hypothetical protein [Nocardia sp. XZ_19_369]
MDHAAAEASLASVRLDILGNDRECDRVARLYLAAGEVPRFDVSTGNFTRDPFLLCASQYWGQRLLDEPTVTVAAECASWLADRVALELCEAVAERWSVEFAVRTRHLVQPADEVLTTLSEFADGVLDRSGLRMICLYQASKLRSNYHFEELVSFLDAVETAGILDSEDSPVFIALRAAGLLGGRPRRTEVALGLVEQAWACPARTYVSIDIITAALDDAPPFDGQGELLRRYACDAVAAHSEDHAFHYRLARGLHLCGDDDAALGAVDEAVKRIPSPIDASDYLVLMARYRDLRHAISVSRDAAAAATAAEEHTDKLLSVARSRIEEADQLTESVRLHGTLSDSTRRLVGFLALFGCAVAFFASSSAVQADQQLGLADRQAQVILLGSSLALFIVIFFGSTSLIHRLGRNRRR